MAENRREFLKMSLGAGTAGLLAGSRGRLSAATSVPGGAEGELLYNGIRLPAEWPPQAKFDYEPMPVPYLQTPPEVIPVDVGRQLFVDDFLIESRSFIQRAWHRAQLLPHPVVKVDQPWEAAGPESRFGPCAAPYSDGAWYDPVDRRFKLWYSIGAYDQSWKTAYAESEDGINWVKPSLDVVPGTNIVLWEESPDFRDSNTIWLDHEEPDPQKRYKAFNVVLKGRFELQKPYYEPRFRFRTSPDGIHWSKPLWTNAIWGDRSTVFYNPFRKVWVFSLRAHSKEVGRCRCYCEEKNLAADNALKPSAYRTWVSADRFDPRHPDPRLAHLDPQLYSLDCTPYESLLVGLFAIWQCNGGRGEENPQKRNVLLTGYSRDGFHWQRPWREPLVGVTYDRWNIGNVQSVGGGFLTVGDKLFIYYSARGIPLRKDGLLDGSTGLATLRRDGFASMDAGETIGTLTTRPVQFKGRHLFVNVDAVEGGLRAEVLGPDGKVIEPFSLDNCEPVKKDSTRASVRWKGVKDLSAVSGKPVRLRFLLHDCSLYAFWISPDTSGASYGYVAAGGPGLTGAIDTVGSGALCAIPATLDS